MRVRDELTFTTTLIVTISPGSTSPIVALIECVPFEIVPLLVDTVETSMKVGKESARTLFVVVYALEFCTFIVNVKLSLTLACVGATEIDKVTAGVGVDVGGVPVNVGVGVFVAVAVFVGVAVAVPVAVAVEVFVDVAVGLLVGVSVGVAVAVLVAVSVSKIVYCTLKELESALE